MIEEAKVKELVKELIHCSKEKEVVICNRWLEENKPEPVVVGLSEEQLNELVEVLEVTPRDLFKPAIARFLRNETFTALEVKEVAVGLSDEQIHQLSAVIYSAFNGMTLQDTRPLIIKCNEYLETQTFAQPVEFSNEELLDSYQSLMEDFEALQKELEQIKAQPFTPCWERIARQDIHHAELVFRFRADAGYEVKELEQSVGAYTRPIPPAPKIEVGQTWKSLGTKVTVIGVNDLDVVYQKLSNSWFLIDPIEDFLSTFEQV